MAKTVKPEDFKFEDSKFKLVIEATGKEDGETIANHIEAEVRCEADFALSVIENFFDKDPEMEALFRKAIAMRSLSSLLDGRLKEMLAELSSDDDEEEETK